MSNPFPVITKMGLSFGSLGENGGSITANTPDAIEAFNRFNELKYKETRDVTIGVTVSILAGIASYVFLNKPGSH